MATYQIEYLAKVWVKEEVEAESAEEAAMLHGKGQDMYFVLEGMQKIHGELVCVVERPSGPEEFYDVDDEDDAPYDPEIVDLDGGFFEDED